MSDQVQIRRDTLANIQAATPAQGELWMATDADLLVIGDGATQGGIPMGPSFPFVAYVSGRYYLVGSPNNSTFTVAANTIYGMPFIAMRKVTFTKAGLQVSSGVAGNAHIGIYSNIANGFGPGALLQDFGAVSTASPGAQEITGLSIPLNPGLYWMAALFSAAPTVLTCGGLGAPAAQILGSSSPAQATNDVAVDASQAYGALPGTFPSFTSITTNNSFPATWMRF